jgi:hypothetical protein
MLIKWNNSADFTANNSTVDINMCSIADDQTIISMSCPPEGSTNVISNLKNTGQYSASIWNNGSPSPAGRYVIKITIKRLSNGLTVYDSSDSYFTISSVPFKPYITVSSPNGGEYWSLGSKQTIKWSAIYPPMNCPVGAYCVSPELSRYDIELVGDDAENTCKYDNQGAVSCYVDYLATPARYILARNVSNNFYNWNVGSLYGGGGESIKQSGAYRIKVCEANTNNCDLSDTYFKITDNSVVKPSITVLSPNGGETLTTGQTYTIKWNSLGVPNSEKVKIEIAYSHNDPTYPGGRYFEDWIAESVPNTGSYSWKVPEYYGTGLQGSSFTVKISNGSVLDYSNANFTIKMGASNPYLTVTGPVRGTNYHSGDKIPVKWTPYDKNSAFSASLLRKNDPSFIRLIDLNPVGIDSESFSWNVLSGLTGNDYYIRVETSSNGTRGTIGYSDVFTINSASTKVDGTCGSAAKEYANTATAYLGSMCTTGTVNPANPTFPAPGTNVMWTCVGLNGGNTPTCGSYRAATTTPSTYPGFFLSVAKNNSLCRQNAQ